MKHEYEDFSSLVRVIVKLVCNLLEVVHGTKLVKIFSNHEFRNLSNGRQSQPLHKENMIFISGQEVEGKLCLNE